MSSVAAGASIVIEHLATGRGDPDEHDPAVARDADAFDEPSLLDPVDQTGRVRQRDVEHLGQPAHRHLAVALRAVCITWSCAMLMPEPHQPLARRRT